MDVRQHAMKMIPTGDFRNRSGIRVSRLTFTERIPAFSNSSITTWRRIPFVVIVSSSRPAGRNKVRPVEWR